MTRYFLPYIVITLFYSCRSQDDINALPISVDYKDSKQIQLSEYFTLVKVCPLETTPENLMGHIKKIEIYNTDFYILDEANNCVFHHDSSGRFINQLNKIGRGPQEYMRITDLKVNDNGIFILDYSQQSIIQYDHNLQFIRKTHLDFFASEFLLQQENIFFYSERANNKQDYCFYSTDYQGNTVSSYVQRRGLKHECYNFQSSNVFCFNSDSLFSPRNSNYIYSQNHPDCTYKLDFKDKTFPEEKLNIEEYDLYSPQFPFIVREHLYQYNNHLFISYFYNKKRRFAHYDMDSKQSLFNGEFINDLIPQFRFFPQWQKNAYWIDCIDSYTLLNDFTDIAQSILPTQQLQDTDNPILIIYKIKDI